MIKVDDRAGSKEFKRLLVRAGAPAKVQRLPFADFSFWGNGGTGRVRVGIERKTVSEIISAIADSRFIGHQLPGLLTRYPAHCWLLVEGNFYPDPKTGLLMVSGRPAGFTRQSHLYENIEKFLLTLQLKAGLRLVKTQNKTHTACWLKACYVWYQKDWRAHKSAYKVDETRPDAVIFERRTMKRKIANQLTGLAWTRSVKADVYFPSIVSMVVGDPDYPRWRVSLEGQQARQRAQTHWQKALGFKEGRKTAARIVDCCYSRDEVQGKGR